MVVGERGVEVAIAVEVAEGDRDDAAAGDERGCLGDEARAVREDRVGIGTKIAAGGDRDVVEAVGVQIGAGDLLGASGSTPAAWSKG